MAADSEDIAAVKEWLASEVKLERYADKLVSNGFISLEICCSIDENVLDGIGIVLPYHRRRLLGFVEKLREKLGMNLTNEDNGVILNTELTSKGAGEGNETEKSLISFDSDGERKEPEGSVSMLCAEEDGEKSEQFKEVVPKDMPQLPPKKTKRPYSVKAPPPPVPPRKDLEEGISSGEPGSKAVHLDTHAQDQDSGEPSHSETTSAQADVPKKKAPVKPPRKAIKTTSENKPETTSVTNVQTDAQRQGALSFSNDIAASFDPLKAEETPVVVNSSSAIPDLPKRPLDNVASDMPEEPAVKESVYGNIEDIGIHSETSIEPKRPAPKAPTRAGSKKPVPVPRGRVKSEDNVIVTALVADRNTGEVDKGEVPTVVNDSFPSRTKSFSTPGNRRVGLPEEKPSTLPRYPAAKRVSPPLPPSRQTGASLKDKRGFPNVPLPPVPSEESAEKQQEEVDGTRQQGTIPRYFYQPRQPLASNADFLWACRANHSSLMGVCMTELKNMFTNHGPLTDFGKTKV